MAHMERQITGKWLWFAIEGNAGTDYVDSTVVGYPRLDRLVHNEPITETLPHLFKLVCSYVDAYTANTDIDSITVIEGYGARLSAPGYMECTEWVVCDSVEEAEAYLDDAYGNDEEDS